MAPLFASAAAAAAAATASALTNSRLQLRPHKEGDKKGTPRGARPLPPRCHAAFRWIYGPKAKEGRKPNECLLVLGRSVAVLCSPPHFPSLPPFLWLNDTSSVRLWIPSRSCGGRATDTTERARKRPWRWREPDRCSWSPSETETETDRKSGVPPRNEAATKRDRGGLLGGLGRAGVGAMKLLMGA